MPALGISFFQQCGLEKGIWKPRQDNNLTVVRVQREKRVDPSVLSENTSRFIFLWQDVCSFWQSYIKAMDIMSAICVGCQHPWFNDKVALMIP